MFALLLELLILKVMGNHVYSFNGTNKLQLEGGPIGLKLSGSIAKVVMLSWSRRFKAATESALRDFNYFKLYLLLFYVDDTFVAAEELEPGSRYIKEEQKVMVVELLGLEFPHHWEERAVPRMWKVSVVTRSPAGERRLRVMGPW